VGCRRGAVDAPPAPDGAWAPQGDGRIRARIGAAGRLGGWEAGRGPASGPELAPGVPWPSDTRAGSVALPAAGSLYSAIGLGPGPPTGLEGLETETLGADLTGRQLGPYRLEGLVGAGAFGSVYRGRHLHLDVVRAVKVLQTELAQVPQLQARFLQEARTAAGLSHPCIVPVYDFGIDQGMRYIVMEYVDSVTLARFMEPLTPVQRLGDAVILGAVRDVAAALDYAHSRGILHRDLKPANVLVRRSDRRALLSDFGVAKVLTAAGLTETGVAIGSYAYMSPEQCSGSGQLSTRSDVYAFAAMLYEIASGDPPFGRGLPAVAGHMSQAVPSVRLPSPGLTRGVDEVLRRGLAKRPEDRPATAGELAAAFLEAVTEPTVMAPGPGPAGSEPSPTIVPGQAPPPRPGVGPTTARSGVRLLVGAALASLLVLVGGAALAITEFLPSIHGGRPTPSSTPAPPRASFPPDFPVTAPQRAVVARLGQPVEVKDAFEDVRITVVDADINDPGTSEASLIDPQRDRFVDVQVRIQNLASSSLPYGAYQWWLSDGNGHPYASVPSPKSPPIPSDEDQLVPGQSVEGYVSFEVPRSASDFEVWATVASRPVRVPLR
jgi:serine/threonine protein kinase